MPVKILLADKSITIQKVVEMLFSGKEYQVLCVSDGETALSEASRFVPDVVLADVDLPRIDGYAFSGRLKQAAALAKTPVILMMSREDVFDEAKAKQGTIVDRIAKPFESQELISKVKKAVSSAPPRLAEPAAPPVPPAAPVPPKPAPAAARPAVSSAPAPTPPKPKKAPADIFDIIEEAPTQADLTKGRAADEDEGVYEVEPVVEVEEPIAPAATALPVGKKAVEEMREGLGLSDKKKAADQEIVSFESLDMAAKSASEFTEPKREAARKPEPAPARRPVPEYEPREYVPPPPDRESPALSEDRLQRIAEETVTRITQEYFATVKPPKVSEDTVRRGIEEAVSKIAREIARDVIEKVAWEVVPDLAEMLIKAEIERIKAET